MTKDERIHRSGAVVIIAASLTASGVQGQEIPVEPGGLELRFGIAERFEYGRNLALDVPDPGNGFIASTILSFGLSSETRSQTIELDAVTGLRLQDLPDREDSFDIGDARLGFGYTREAANAGLELEADYLRFDIGLLRSLSDFEDEDGFIVLPGDFSDLTGEGTRSEYSYGLSFDGGRQNLIGYSFGLVGSGLRYTDTTDTGLSDNDRIGGDVGLSFALSPVTSVSVDYAIERFEEDDDEETERDTDAVSLGLLHEFSALTRLEASIGYTIIDERQVISGDSSESGLIGSVGVVHDVANGSASALLDTSRTISGRLDRFLLGRSFAVPDGDFAATLGAARRPDGTIDAIGSLAFDREYGPNTLRVRLSREILSDDEDEYFAATVIDVGYIWGLTPLSQFSLRALYAVSEATDSSTGVEFSAISAVYSHDIGQDWSLNTGIDYRVRDEDGLDRATSPLVFFGIGKSFVWRP